MLCILAVPYQQDKLKIKSLGSNTRFLKKPGDFTKNNSLKIMLLCSSFHLWSDMLAICISGKVSDPIHCLRSRPLAFAFVLYFVSAMASNVLIGYRF